MLDETTVPAGRPINGVAIVTNATGHPLVIADCHGVWLQVGLSNAKVSYDPGWLTCLSAPGTTLPVGTTRVAITVGTTYYQCSEHAGSAVTDMPACLHRRHGPTMPPLPPGTYATKAVMLQPKGVRAPTPAAVQVTLTA